MSNDLLKTFTLIGASNHSLEDRESMDYYASDPKALRFLLEKESFTPTVWENAVGGGILAEGLKENGYQVICSDIIDRGYPDTKIVDFLEYHPDEPIDIDIITNPPYKYAAEFVKNAMDMIVDGRKVAYLLKIQFLEGKTRRQLFEEYPPKTIYVFTKRLLCAKNGEFEKCKHTSALCFAWFVWEKGFHGDPIIKWVN